MVALRSGTAEYGPLRNSLSDRNYRKIIAQDNVHGNKKGVDVHGSRNGDDVLGNTKDDNALDFNHEKNLSHPST
jgi:hypothetical protein